MIWVYVMFRQRHSIHWIFQFLGIAMYMVASVDIGFTVWLLFEKILKGQSPCQFVTARYLWYVTNKYVFLHAYREGDSLFIYPSTLADILLLYRCYVVWNRDRRILIGPAILFVATTVCGYLLGISSPTRLGQLSRIYISLTFVLNVILTTLIGTQPFPLDKVNKLLISISASRIWWISRLSGKTLHPKLSHRYVFTLMILSVSSFLTLFDLTFQTLKD